MPDITLSDDEIRALATLAGDSPIADKLRNALPSEPEWPEGTIAWIDIEDDGGFLVVRRHGGWWAGGGRGATTVWEGSILSVTPIRVLRDDEIAVPRIADPPVFRRAATAHPPGSYTWRLLNAYADTLDAYADALDGAS